MKDKVPPGMDVESGEMIPGSEGENVSIEEFDYMDADLCEVQLKVKKLSLE